MIAVAVLLMTTPVRADSGPENGAIQESGTVQTSVNTDADDALADDTAPDEAAPGEAGEQRELIIEVEEELPVNEIEDEEVPLAGWPSADSASAAEPEHRTASGLRHAAMMAVFLIAVILYTIYFVMYDKRLYGLRREAARREMMYRKAQTS